MKKTQGPANPIVLRKGMSIGTGNAESDDEFLFSCFVEYPPVEECLRLTSPTMIIGGRTGEGKTAILRHIESEVEHCAFVDPTEMSMSYVSNSDALRFLTSVDADLDLLFQVLWKHVLCIEYIRLRWNVSDTIKSRSIFNKIMDRFSKDQRKERAIEYLRNWQGKFWITMDQNIKEITEAYETKLHADFGADIKKFSAGGQYDKRLSAEKKSEIVARSRKIINSDQLSELHHVIDMLSILEIDDQKSYYILIDRLDEKWVDDTVRFKMIRALLQTLKSFRKLKNLKVLVALRSDVFERVVQESGDISFQREKLEDNMIRLQWNKTELRSLVDKRVNALFERKYTGQNVHFDDIFPNQIANKAPFDWITERTLMRPRDVIAFVNEALNAASGSQYVSNTALKKAEGEFARKRRDALLQEWKSAFPSLEAALAIFSKRKRPILEFRDILLQDDVDELALKILDDVRLADDPIHPISHGYINAKAALPEDLMKHIVAMLYRCGAVGLKLDPAEPYVYSHINQPLVSPELIQPSTKIRLHPMLHAAYHLHEA